MVGIKTVLLIFGFLLFSPHAYALYEDPGYGKTDQEEGLYEEAIYNEHKQQFLAERKQLLQKALPQRAKKKKTLTPFVYSLSKEEQIAFLKKQKTPLFQQKNSHPKKLFTSPHPRKKASSGIFSSLMLLSICILISVLVMRLLRKNI